MALFAVGAYLFSRQWLSSIAAIGVALLTIGAPEMAYWGRQVMLDIPAYAMAMIGVVFVCHYLRHSAPASIYLATAFFLAAVYTKYNFAFLVLPAAAAVLVARGWRVLLDRHVIIAMAVGFIALLPAAYMFYRFGAVNVTAVVDQPGGMARHSFAAWTYYTAQLPHQLGYATVGLAVAGLVLSLSGRLKIGLEPWAWALLVAWFAGGYLFFSLISHKEPRMPRLSASRKAPMAPRSLCPNTPSACPPLSRYCFINSWARSIFQLLSMVTTLIPGLFFITSWKPRWRSMTGEASFKPVISTTVPFPSS